MKSEKPDPAALHVPPQWYWYYRKLQSLRESLIENSAEQIAEFSEWLEPPGDDAADSATDEFDHNLALGLLAHEEDALYEIDVAIQRILEGTYGICEITGKPIPQERLRVVPWTRYTKESLECLEKRQLVERPHLESVVSIQGPAPGGLAEAPEPDGEATITIEDIRRRREEGIRALAGDAGLTITAPLAPEP